MNFTNYGHALFKRRVHIRLQSEWSSLNVDSLLWRKWNRSNDVSPFYDPIFRPLDRHLSSLGATPSWS